MTSKNKITDVETRTADSISLNDSLKDLASKGFNKFQFLRDEYNNGKAVWIIVAYKTHCPKGDLT